MKCLSVKKIIALLTNSVKISSYTWVNSPYRDSRLFSMSSSRLTHGKARIIHLQMRARKRPPWLRRPIHPEVDVMMLFLQFLQMLFRHIETRDNLSMRSLLLMRLQVQHTCLRNAMQTRQSRTENRPIYRHLLLPELLFRPRHNRLRSVREACQMERPQPILSEPGRRRECIARIPAAERAQSEPRKDPPDWTTNFQIFISID